MTVARLTKRRNKLERQAVEVMHDLLDKSISQVAAKYKVARISIYAFQERHAEEIKELAVRTKESIDAYKIADKAHRIAVKDQLETLLEEVRQSRANGGTGMHTGLVAKTYRMIGSGENAELVEEYKIDTALVAAFDQLHKSAAEELGQLPKGDTNIQVNVPILIRRFEDVEPEKLA